MKTVIISRAAIVQCTVGPRSIDTRLIRTPVYNGQFLLSRRKADIFSLNLTCLIRTPVKRTTDTYLCPESHILIVNLTLRTLVFCALSLTEYPENTDLTNENLSETANDLLNVPSNALKVHLAKSQTKIAITK